MPLPDVVSLQTRQSNLEGTGEIPLRRLVKEALRMRPSRIIVGEVRQEECLDLGRHPVTVDTLGDLPRLRELYLRKDGRAAVKRAPEPSLGPPHWSTWCCTA